MTNRKQVSKQVVLLISVVFNCVSQLAWISEVTAADGPRYYEQVQSGQPKLIECDVAVYGGTPAGVTAAIQAAREGKKAVLLSFNRHVGGMTSGGLTATDLGRKDSIGGLALEFYNRIGRARDYRPSEAETLFRKMLDEAGVKVLLTRGSYRWPDGTYKSGSITKLPSPRRGLPMPPRELYELRERIFQDHVNYQQGLMHFLANDPRVPEALRARVNAWGLDPQEFQESGFWPHQLYVREGRRMVSDYVVTQADCESRRVVEDSVGLASYPMDSHFCQRVVVEENGVQTVRNEGGFGHGFPKPYPVSYRSIVPRKNECENLLVPVCLSSSHVAYGSIRMEPVFMILGQSAGTAAAMTIDNDIAVQDVDYRALKAKLERDGQRLVWDDKSVRKPAKTLPGLVTDDTDAQTTGSWTSGALSPVCGLTYLHDGNNGKGEKTATFKINVPKPGTYEVSLLYVASANRSTKTPVTVSVVEDTKEMAVNQREGTAVGSSLGNFRINDSMIVTVSNRNTDGFVVVDGVQLLLQPQQ